jgi:hypothetical protein
MATQAQKCEICGRKAKTLTICKSCGKHYCDKCQSPSTSQEFCKECVSMEGVVTKEE